MSKKQSGKFARRVTELGDRRIIETTPQRAEAILLFLSGCTLEEVGQRFGISRERVRQYVEQAGLGRKDRKLFAKGLRGDARAWDRTRTRRHARKSRRRQRVARVVQVIRDYTTEYGKPPTHNALARILFPTGVAMAARISAYLGAASRHPKYQGLTRVHAVYRLAGVRSHGQSGEGQHQAKLDNETVRSARAAWRLGIPTSEIIRLMRERAGISWTCAWQALQGKTWKHVA